MCSKNECARTDIVFLPISEVCDGTVSLRDELTNDRAVKRTAPAKPCLLNIKKVDERDYIF